MLRFNNDYNHGAHPRIIEAFAMTNDHAFAGYGNDEWCDRAKELVKEVVGRPDADIHFVPGATQVNFIVIAAALNPVQSVVAPKSGHINCHEAASIEHTGHKILELPPTDGKITKEQVLACAKEYYECGEPEHLTEPKMVYISFATEDGTLYSLEELEGIAEVCHKYGMYLFVDGARMGYGLGSPKNDVDIKDFGRLADAFYLGGTKCGCMFGEALVITNKDLKKRFRAYMKQSGAVLAKGWTMGLQFHALLNDGEYFRATKHAVELAMRIREAFEKKGIPFATNSYTNQQFVIMTPAQVEKLGKDFIFEHCWPAGDGNTVERFCTSWATKEEEVDKLIEGIMAL